MSMAIRLIILILPDKIHVTYSKTPDAAAKDAVKFINSLSKSENREYGGSVDRVVTQTISSDGNIKNLVRYVTSQPTAGDGNSVPISVNKRTTVAIYHTHGDYSKIVPNGES
jgi:hypothetical protein